VTARKKTPFAASLALFLLALAGCRSVATRAVAGCRVRRASDRLEVATPPMMSSHHTLSKFVSALSSEVDEATKAMVRATPRVPAN